MLHRPERINQATRCDDKVCHDLYGAVWSWMEKAKNLRGNSGKCRGRGKNR